MTASISSRPASGSVEPEISSASSTSSEERVVLETRVVSGQGGGPDKTILKTPRYLTSTPYRTLCAYMHPPDDPGFEVLRGRAQAWEAPLISVPDRGAWDWRVPGQMLEICRHERVAIWHGHDYKSNALGLLLNRRWPMRLVTTVHGWVKRTAKTPLYYGIDRFCLKRYERVLCVSEDLHRECLALGLPASRCVLIENGIVLEDYQRRHDLAEAKRRLGLAPDRLVVGAVGRLSPEKGFEALIAGVAGLRRRGIAVDLVIAGEGDHRDALVEAIDRESLAEHVHLLGFCADPRDVYEAIDVFALSSLREGLPNVLLEAMATGVPCLATRIAGVPRLIEDGHNGLLIDVEPDLAGQIERALARLLEDAELRKRLGVAGQRRVAERHSFAERMRAIRAIYDELIFSEGGTGR